MNRREFLKYCTVLGASLTLGNNSAYASWLTNKKRNGFPQGMLLIDAHAHPDQFYYLGDELSLRAGLTSLEMRARPLKKSRRSGCTEATSLPSVILKMSLSHSAQVMTQVNRVVNLEEQGLVKIVRRHKDMPHGSPPKGYIPGAILSLEGATPLGTDLDKVDELYDLGVRLITPMH